MDKTMRAVVILAINAEKSESATDAVKLTAPITLKHTKIQSNLSIGAMSSMANTTNLGLWQPGRSGNTGGRPRVAGAISEPARAETDNCGF